jgi:hypothetical protein
MLVCYDFHFGIFHDKEDLMFVTEPKLFSIRTTFVLKLAMLEHVSSTPSISIGLVEQVCNC